MQFIISEIGGGDINIIEITDIASYVGNASDEEQEEMGAERRDCQNPDCELSQLLFAGHIFYNGHIGEGWQYDRQWRGKKDWDTHKCHVPE